jgi:hypothetical protein
MAMRLGLFPGLFVGAVVLATATLPAIGIAEPVAPKGPLNTLVDVRDALRGCWQWPPLQETKSGMDLTIRLSFKSNGEIFGFRITYQSPNVAEDEQALYYGVLLQALRLCSPLPVSESLGSAIAGRPFFFRFHDTRQQRKA